MQTSMNVKVIATTALKCALTRTVHLSAPATRDTCSALMEVYAMVMVFLQPGFEGNRSAIHVAFRMMLSPWIESFNTVHL